MAKKNVRLHAEDGKPLRYITMDDSNSRLAACEAEAHYDKGGKWLGIKLRKYVPNIPASDSPDSTVCLTDSDSENNAMGCVDSKKRHVSREVPIGRRRYGRDEKEKPDPNIIGNYIDRAMSKVEAWPFVGDEKAVRAGCRIPCQS